MLLLLILWRAFLVRSVDCQYQGLINHSQELTLVCQDIEQALTGRSLLFSDFNRSSVWQEIANNQQYQHNYHLQSSLKILPHQLVLTLDSKAPDYRLSIVQADGARRSFLLNQNNRLRTDQAELDVLNIVCQADAVMLESNDSYLDSDYHQLFLKLSQAVSQQDLPVKQVLYQSDELWQLDLGRSWLVVIDRYTDFERATQQLAIVLADQQAENIIQGHHFLDLRFNLPVVRDQL